MSVHEECRRIADTWDISCKLWRLHYRRRMPPSVSVISTFCAYNLQIVMPYLPSKLSNANVY
jgi:hypothetical protein